MTSTSPLKDPTGGFSLRTEVGAPISQRQRFHGTRSDDTSVLICAALQYIELSLLFGKSYLFLPASPFDSMIFGAYLYFSPLWVIYNL